MKRILLRGIIVLVTVVLLVVNGNSLRDEYNSSQSQSLMESELPASIQVAGVVLGPLKGLLVDVLWWRSERLMENKEFFEALQLSDWITSLHPTYPSVWSYQGFNLAFNISHNFSNLEERWDWILEGIKLLRDKGIKFNPDWEHNRDIRFELVHIFYRKIEGVSDTESKKFQDKWTLEMLKYFERGDRQELEEIVSAPSEIEQLLRDVDIAKLSNEFEGEGKTLRLMIETNQFSYRSLKKDTPENLSYNSAIVKIIYFLKRRAIEQELNMDVERILQTDKEFGPFDWRTHHAQIVYWGMVEKYDSFKLRGLNYSEYILASMLSSFYNGRVVFSEKNDYFQKTHNLEILPKLHSFFSFILFESNLDEGSKKFKRFSRIYRDFLERSIVITYTYNQVEASRELFEHYKKYFAEGDSVTFEQYVIQGFSRSVRVENKGARRAFLESILYKAIKDAFRGEWDTYHGHIRIAKLIHKTHQLQNKDIPSNLLPPLKDILISSRKQFMKKTGKSDKEMDNLESQSRKFSIPKKKLKIQ